MANTIVQYPLDLTGTNPNNLVGSEEHLLVSISGFPYRIITMEHGGFYSKSLKVFDEAYNPLRPNVDYIWTYRHKNLSERTGRDIASAIVFINHALQGKVILQAQMVGGDLAYSFTVVSDYIAFYNSNPHVPTINDYIGAEPIWAPGELANERWGLDKFQPFNNELENIRRALTVGAVNAETDFRTEVKDRYDVFMARFNDRLERHIADKNDPHQINPDQVGLGVVQNYPLATQASAAAGSSNVQYLTPSLAHYTIGQAPTIALNAHINLRPADPHDTTPAQINADSKSVQTQRLAQYHNKTDTVDNTAAINWNGSLIDVDTYRQIVRSNLDTSTFPRGILEPNQLTYGTAGPTKLLRGDGTWADVAQLQPEYGATEESKIIQLSRQPSTATALNILNTTYNNLAVAPVGTIAFYTLRVYQQQGNGNGSSHNTHTFQYAAARTNSGWVTV